MSKRDLILSPVKPPCTRECTDRAIDCHGKCEIYASYRAECDRVRQERMQELDVLEAIGDAMKRIPGKRGI